MTRRFVRPTFFRNWRTRAAFSVTTEFASGAAYEGRRDLGNTQRGDGVRFKGRGLVQITGRANYDRYGKLLGVDLVNNPPLAAAFPWAALTGGQYWTDRGINAKADRDDIVSVTRAINGGTNGLDDRRSKLAAAKLALRSAGVSPRSLESAERADAAVPMSDWAAGLGIGIGATLAVCGIVILAVFLYKRRKDATSTAPGKEPLLRVSPSQDHLAPRLRRLSGASASPHLSNRSRPL